MKKHLLAAMAFAITGVASVPAKAQREITFDSKTSGTSSSHHHSSKHRTLAKNSLSVGLISWFNGYTPLYYERAVTDFMSIQVGLGVTTRSFGNDLGVIASGEGTQSPNFLSGYGYNDIEDHYDNYNFRKTIPGLYASFAPKFYYSDDVMDGKYVSPMVEYKQFRYRAQKADENAPVSSDDDHTLPHTPLVQNESVRCIDFTVNFGGHFQSRNHMMVGWSIGTGIRNAKSERLDIGTTTNALGETHYANAVQSYDKTKFLLTFNFIIGGCF